MPKRSNGAVPSALFHRQGAQALLDAPARAQPLLLRHVRRDVPHADAVCDGCVVITLLACRIARMRALASNGLRCCMIASSDKGAKQGRQDKEGACAPAAITNPLFPPHRDRPNR